MRYSYKQALSVLKEYALGEGYSEVRVDHSDTSVLYWSFDRVNVPVGIYIQSGYTWELKTYLLLHELGHHELRKNWSVFEERFPLIAKAEMVYFNEGHRRHMYGDRYNVSCLEEEYAAWDEGLRLAGRFGIPIRFENWVKLKTKCLKSYIDYYSNK